MDGQDSEEEIYDDVCIFCGRKLLKGEGRFSKPDGLYCVGCYEEMKLEPRNEDARDGE